jgi:hypothetical protein
MGRQDYLLRIIEIAGRVLRELLTRLRAGEAGPAEVADRLRSTASGAGIDLDVMGRVDLDTLVLLVSPAGEPEPGRCWLAAELFAVEAFCAEAAGEPERALDASARALRLFALVDPAIVARGLPETTDRVSELRALVDRLADA